jgi:transcriptional regulator with XRE-family HTH domain
MTQAKHDGRWRTDWNNLCIALETTRARRGLSLRKVAAEMGVPVTGLSKLRRGDGALSADAVARLLAWLYPRSVPWWITDGTNDSEEDDDA